MPNRSSRSRIFVRAALMAALACLSGCSFFLNEFVPLDVAPAKPTSNAASPSQP